MLLLALLFTVLFAITLGCVGLGQAAIVSSQKAQVRKMLKYAAPEIGKRRQDLEWDRPNEERLSHALRRFSLFQQIENRISQAELDWTLDKFIILTFGAALVGLLLGEVLPVRLHAAWIPVALIVVFASLPFLIVQRKRKRRFAAFEEQFPEALNFLSRSMRAGHAFTIGLEMLVADAPEPLASCFKKVLSNLQLGSPLDISLYELTATMPLIDVRFFASSVLLQQTSGGNLGEIMDTMARIIRERFRVKGAVKAASAHGRVTGMVLSIMPAGVGLIMLLIAPDYLMKMVNDPLGRKLMMGSGIAQIIGFFCIKKIINIKV